MARARKEILLNGGNEDDVKCVIRVLNGDDPKLRHVTTELKKLVTAWEASGRNLKAMMESDRSSWKGLSLREQLRDAYKPEWRPTKQGGAYIVLVPGPNVGAYGRPRFGREQWSLTFNEKPWSDSLDKGQWSPRSEALLLFYMLTIGPWEKMSNGPCRCGRYFIKKRIKQVCCDEKCARIKCSADWNKQQRDKAHKKKLETARAGIEELNTLSVARRKLIIDWKQSVKDTPQCRKAGVTRWFLTHATNEHNGRPAELTPPTGY